jgi:hypothetical protein
MKKMGKLTERRKRVEQVNELVKYIGSLGKRFFYYEKKGRYAEMVINDRGNLWWRDHFSNKDIYLHHTYWEINKGISVESAFINLINHFKDYVMTGKQIKNLFAPWESTPNLWGYGEENMRLIRKKAVDLGIHVWKPDDLNFTDTIEITSEMMQQTLDTVLKDSTIRLRRYNEKDYMIMITND